MVGGGNGPQLPLHWASDYSYPESHNFPVFKLVLIFKLVFKLVLIGLGNVLLKKLWRSAGDSLYTTDNISLMEEPYQEDDTTCRFPVINLVMAGGSNGLVLVYARLWVIPTLKTLIPP